MWGEKRSNKRERAEKQMRSERNEESEQDLYSHFFFSL